MNHNPHPSILRHPEDSPKKLLIGDVNIRYVDTRDSIVPLDHAESVQTFDLNGETPPTMMRYKDLIHLQQYGWSGPGGPLTVHIGVSKEAQQALDLLFQVQHKELIEENNEVLFRMGRVEKANLWTRIKWLFTGVKI